MTSEFKYGITFVDMDLSSEEAGGNFLLLQLPVLGISECQVVVIAVVVSH